MDNDHELEGEALRAFPSGGLEVVELFETV